MSRKSGQGNNQAAPDQTAAPLETPSFASAPLVDGVGLPQPKVHVAHQVGMEPHPALAKNNPVQISRQIEPEITAKLGTSSFDVHTQLGAELEVAKESDVQMEEPDALGFRSKAERLAFMNDDIVVNIHETNEQGAEDPVCFSVNGRPQYIRRGQDTKVKRYYVERMLRTRRVTYRSVAGRNANGDEVNQMIPKAALAYPFNVIYDPSPKGPLWVKTILGDPN